MSHTDKFNGTWNLGIIPDDYIKIMKVLGYNTLERKWFKNTKTLVKSTLEGDKLTLEIKGRAFNKIKEYYLNKTPIEYNDDDGNPIMEISKWKDEKTIQIKSIFLTQNVTMIDTREMLNDDECKLSITMLHQEDDHPIEVEMILTRVPSNPEIKEKEIKEIKVDESSDDNSDGLDNDEDDSE